MTACNGRERPSPQQGGGQTQGTAAIMTLPQENWGRKARRRDAVKHGFGWDMPSAASMYGGKRHSTVFPQGVREWEELGVQTWQVRP